MNTRPEDRILSPEQAHAILERETGIKGWKRLTLTHRIRNGWRFKWIEGVHYIMSDRGLAAVNVDAIKRELLK